MARDQRAGNPIARMQFRPRPDPVIASNQLDRVETDRKKQALGVIAMLMRTDRVRALHQISGTKFENPITLSQGKCRLHTQVTLKPQRRFL